MTDIQAIIKVEAYKEPHPHNLDSWACADCDNFWPSFTSYFLWVWLRILGMSLSIEEDNSVSHNLSMTVSLYLYITTILSNPCFYNSLVRRLFGSTFSIHLNDTEEKSLHGLYRNVCRANEVRVVTWLRCNLDFEWVWSSTRFYDLWPTLKSLRFREHFLLRTIETVP